MKVERCKRPSTHVIVGMRYIIDGSRTFMVNDDLDKRCRTEFKWRVDLEDRPPNPVDQWCHEQWGNALLEPVLIRSTYGPDSIYHHYAKWMIATDWLYLKSDQELMMFKLAWA